MENIQPLNTFSIGLPTIGDEEKLNPMHIQGWKETYVKQNPELTEDDVDNMLAHLSDTTFRHNTIMEALEHPDRVLYRVVKNKDGDIIGFMHAAKKESHNELEGLYLLDEAKGKGVGDALMKEFLKWVDNEKPCTLHVFTFNERAIHFYEKYGFKVTDTPVQFYKDRLSYITMELPKQS